MTEAPVCIVDVCQYVGSAISPFQYTASVLDMFSLPRSRRRKIRGRKMKKMKK